MVKSEKNGMKKGAWSDDEDNKLRAYIHRYGHWNWALLPKFAGVSRSGKSCRWSAIATNLPGRSDNEIKNRWNTYLKKQAQKDHIIVLENEEEDDGTLKLNEANYPQENLVEITYPQQVEILGARTSSSESPISPISIDQLSSHSSSSWDYAVSSDDVTQQPFDCEPTTNFWTDPFILDDDNIISSSSDHLFTPLDLVEDYIYLQCLWS
ncbi:hypothetical protein L6452_17429 [Arctium lappa]|uniref:Uncharacterized protein n=1 Tax=Arctium lappa TaxID=4217 RepID=A0ACB9C3E5_ARCLA|nr:hypothetical protein L6452_17429 [Arctium lappa]